MKALNFIYETIERRRCKRVDVFWDALLEAKFSDFCGQIDVKVMSFSSQGALLHSERLTVKNQHLFLVEKNLN